jgi:hypothetical protein
MSMSLVPTYHCVPPELLSYESCAERDFYFSKARVPIFLSPA